MIIDSAHLAPGQELAGDVAIVGGGAAGITLARKLGARGHSVLLLESGRFQYSAPTQDLYRGAAIGPALPEDSEYLASSRLRFFGGSTNHWGGFCVPLDDMDFEALPWVAHSGWPIGPRDLESHYPESAAYVRIIPFEEQVSEDERRTLLLANSARIRTTFLHMSPRVQFSRLYGDEIESSERVRLVLPADVLNIQLAPDGGSVAWLDVASLEGARLRIRAREIVLATGGVENARLLLASDSVHPSGVGNGHDLVGRFFLEHPHVHVGEAVLTRPPAPLAYYRLWFGPAKKRHAVLCLTEETRRREGLLNASVEFHPDTRSPVALEGLERAEAHTVAALARLARQSDAPSEVITGGLHVRSEQAPNRESRVRLGEERDAHGMRRASLEWRLQSRDLETIAESARIVAEELGRAGEGRVRLFHRDDDPWARTVGGNHHLGTTRMASSPREGVVDPQCRVFGVGNLYVAGSSVFPTGGFANPTFTIVALALRLADHLDRVLHRG